MALCSGLVISLHSFKRGLKNLKNTTVKKQDGVNIAGVKQSRDWGTPKFSPSYRSFNV